jgi:hypothetical protein
MPDNEFWYTGKNKKKDIIKLEYPGAYRRCRTSGGRQGPEETSVV